MSSTRQPEGTWVPTPESIAATNVGWLMQRVGVTTHDQLQAWSAQHRGAYWKLAIERLGIRFQKPFDFIMDLAGGVENPRWLVNASLNIVESCFTARPDATAIIYQPEGGAIATMTFGELRKLTDRVASSLKQGGFKPGDALAIVMPMTAEAVAIYLGIIKAGCVVVGIADSFRPKEIATRLRLSAAKAVFTQDVQLRGGKALPLYATVLEASAPIAIVLPAKERLELPLREGDVSWTDFLSGPDTFFAVARQPEDPINILFSSGTTGEPKAIPWTQTVPIKCAADAHFHQDIRPGDVVIWPTNIGWMMGPWLIFASLINRAAMGLYYGAPTGREFARFVQDARATVLGVVPSLVKAWRGGDCVDGLDWSGIRLFSSTGECSQAGDMRWLMEMAGHKPVIEYCGGTEIGGAYLTGTVAKPCAPGAFNTPALGLDLVVLDERGAVADQGELYLVPPSIGLSTSLLNRDHHEIYFAGTPRGPHDEILRRHGDQMMKLPGGFWCGHGRADDTMNLGGIKVSSAEIERVLQAVPGVVETAAIAVSPGGGPSQLVIYAVCAADAPVDKSALAAALQTAIKRDLNPLFRIHDIVVADALPRTASNKVMRRVIREQYLARV
jgi:acetyl-CoA synthetase